MSFLFLNPHSTLISKGAKIIVFGSLTLLRCWGLYSTLSFSITPTTLRNPNRLVHVISELASDRCVPILSTGPILIMNAGRGGDLRLPPPSWNRKVIVARPQGLVSIHFPEDGCPGPIGDSPSSSVLETLVLHMVCNPAGFWSKE